MNKLIEIALAEVGTKENPPNSNLQKYGELYNLNGKPWCGLFVSYVYEKAGFPLPKIGYRFNGFAGTQTALYVFRKNGKIVSEPEEGDIVFFDFNKDKRPEHVGIFVRKIDDEWFESIEGNTSVTDQSNGGEVMVRRRKFTSVIDFVRP